jgi:DNA-directed RNA polymerase II subunit RPB3
VPNRFYFEVESVGNLEPDQIIQEGIKVVQRKLYEIFRNLEGKEGDDEDKGDDFGGVRSPNMDMNGAGWQDQGYTTPYGGGNQSAWGGNMQTPYNATTPYGSSGQSGWH